MKLQVAERDVQQIGQVHEKRAAQIELNPVIFEILSGKIYSNKILAVIRELSCNAVDAHKMAGHEKPFDVQLPTIIEPVFRIRDYGVGLCHEDIFNLYMTFGASAKRNSDSLIGGLGIGSKAPLAYTNAFTVSSYFNGEQRSYSVFIDEDGKPATSHIHTQITDEPNGLEISVPVKTSDVNTFAHEADKVYRYFNPIKPNFLGTKLNISYPEYLIPFDNNLRWGWCVTNTPSSPRVAVAVMGNIGYPLSYSEVVNHPAWNSNLQSVIYSPINIEFDIGELDIAASREALSYTPKTQATIIKRLAEIHSFYKEDFQKQLDAQPNIWKASCYFTNNQNITKSWFRYETFTYKGVEIDSVIKTEQDIVTGGVYGVFLGNYPFSLKRIPLKFSLIQEVNPSNINAIVVYDSASQSQAKLRTLYDQGVRGLLVVQPVHGKGRGKAFGDFLKKIEGHPKLIKMSDVTPDAKWVNQGKKVVRKTVQLKVCYEFGEGKDAFLREDNSFDLNSLKQPIVVVRTQNNNTFIQKEMLDGTHINIPLSLSKIGNILKESGYKEDIFVTVPLSRFSKKIKEHPMVITIEDWFKDTKTIKLLTEKSSFLEKKRAVVSASNPNKIRVVTDLLESRALRNRNTAIDILKKYEEQANLLIKNKVFTDKEETVLLALNYFFTKFLDKKIIILKEHENMSLKDLGVSLDEGEEFFDKYPLLQYLSVPKYAIVNKEQADAIDNYMDLIDKVNEV